MKFSCELARNIIHIDIHITYIYLQTNTFQCVLATSTTDSYVILLYADGEIQWTTKGVLAGINIGDGINSITIPGSLTPSIINIARTSNVGTPGVWMFKVDGGNVLYNNICITLHGQNKGNHRDTSATCLGLH